MKQEEEYKIDYNSPNIPASVKELKPKIYKDGSAWRASSNEDLANVIFARGSTPEQAMQDFDDNYAKAKENSV